MSGGSFNYLCFHQPEQLLNCDEDLEHMFDALIKTGYAQDAAAETYEALLIARQARLRMAVIAERLYPVWKNMEWWVSRDSSEEQFKKALEEYRSRIVSVKE